MVETNNSSKVLKVLEIVLNDCLSVKRDDTLIEKLFTFLRNDLDLNLEEKQSVLKCLEKSIDLSLNELKTNNDCSDWNLIAIKLRICGSIVSDEDLFLCQRNCLKFIELIAIEVINSNKSSLKFSFFRCLNDICVQRLPRNWILSTSLSNSTNFKTFPQLLWYFLNKSETRFVEHEVLKLFVCLLNHSLSETDLTQNFDPIIAEVISSSNPTNIGIIKEIMVSIELREEFIRKYKIIDRLVDCIEIWNQMFSEKLFYLSQILGLCVDSNEKAIEITDKLIALKDMKSLIGFLTHYIKCHTNYDKNLLQKWFNYTIGWFAVKCGQTDSYDFPISDAMLLERLSDKTITDFCLKQILELDSIDFESKQFRVIFELISKLIEISYKKPEMRKTLLQSFCVLERIALNSKLTIETIECLLDIYSNLLSFLSNDFKLIVLKSLRVLISSKDLTQNSIFIKIIEKLTQILSENDINGNEWEVIDSALEVIYSLLSLYSKSDINLISICPQLLITVLSIWSPNNDNICSTIRSTLISVLLLIHLKAPKHDLNELCIAKDNDCPDLESLLSLLLTEDLMVRINIIKTLDENIDSLIAIERQNKQIFERILKIVCKLSINDLDEDLQTIALKLLQKLFDKLCQQNQVSETINLFFDSYYFHITYHIINCSEYLFKVKQISVENIEQIQNKWHSLTDKQSEQTLEPIITRKLSNHSNSELNLNQIISIDSKIIFDFIMNFDIKDFEGNESEDRPQLNVLDDILSISLIDTNILIDCY